MDDAGVAAVVTRLTKTHGYLLAAVEPLRDEQLRWSPGLSAPSIAFHLWHCARWADRLQAALPGLTPALARLGSREEIWRERGLARAWGFPAGQLGTEETGWGMDEEHSALLPLPSRDLLLDYAQNAFAAANETVSAVTAADFSTPGVDLYGTPAIVGNVLLSHIGHTNRHLGMIEAMKGVQQMRGTATS